MRKLCKLVRSTIPFSFEFHVEWKVRQIGGPRLRLMAALFIWMGTVKDKFFLTLFSISSFSKIWCIHNHLTEKIRED